MDQDGFPLLVDLPHEGCNLPHESPFFPKRGPALAEQVGQSRKKSGLRLRAERTHESQKSSPIGTRSSLHYRYPLPKFLPGIPVP